MAFRLRMRPLLWLLLSLEISLTTCLSLHKPKPRGPRPRPNGAYDSWPPIVTQRAVLPSRNESQIAIDRRGDLNAGLSTCGYLNGDPDKIRTANSGFNCRVDTKNALWGFCPTTVISATDCGLAGSCFDSGPCLKGCGLTQSTQLTTFTCEEKDFCSFALLTFGVDQTYSYIACGGFGKTDHYQISPTSSSPSSTTTPTTTPKQTSATSTSQPPTSSPHETSSNPTSTGTTPSRSRTTAAAPTGTLTDSPPDTGGKSNNNTGAIIGGVIGGLALICGSAVAIIYLLRRHRAPPAYDGPVDPLSKQSQQPGRAGSANESFASSGVANPNMVYELSSVGNNGVYAELAS